MSRSWRTHPCGQICSCKSERWDKRFWHRKFRSKGRMSCRRIAKERAFTCWFVDIQDDCFVFRPLQRVDYETEDWKMDVESVREVSNPWWMNKDGKMWYVEDYVRKRDKVFKGRKILWYCFTSPEWLSDRQIRKLMSK